jgi:hypothetical protein
MPECLHPRSRRVVTPDKVARRRFVTPRTTASVTVRGVMPASASAAVNELTWAWASIRPGSIVRSFTSMISALPAGDGTSRSSPIAAITAPSTTTMPRSKTPCAPAVITRPLRRTIGTSCTPSFSKTVHPVGRTDLLPDETAVGSLGRASHQGSPRRWPADRVCKRVEDALLETGELPTRARTASQQAGGPSLKAALPAAGCAPGRG